MDRYSEWLLQQRDSLGWRVADIYFRMKRYLEDHRRVDTSFAFARDGVHPDSLGHWIMARAILRYLGEKVSEGDGMAVVLGGKDREILTLVEEKQELMKDAWLTAAGHKRPGMKKGLPLEEAKAREAEIQKRITALNK